MIPDETPNTQKLTAYNGSVPRLLEVDAAGLVTASKTFVTAKLADATAISLLTVETNWDVTGAYTGTTITGTYEGQYYQAGNYHYICYSDNVWKRIVTSGFSVTIGTLTLLGLGGKSALFYDSSTGESGTACLEIAGEQLVKGNVLCYLIGGTSGRVTKCPTSGVSHSMPIGVALTAASGAGETCWVAKSGIVQVLPEAGITAAFGNVLVTSTSEAGKVQQYATVPAGDHWDEVGHWQETGSGNGALAKAGIHFN